MIGVDTSVIIDILRGKTFAQLKETDDELCTSEIVAYELLFGIYASRNFSQKRLQELEAALDSFAFVFQIDRRASSRAARIAGSLAKEGKPIGDADSLIAGSLLANGCSKLATRDAADFKRVSGLEVVEF